MKNRDVLTALLVMAALLVAGCAAPSLGFRMTMNQERAMLRAAADNAFTLALDRMESPAAAEEYRARAHAVTLSVLKMLEGRNPVDFKPAHMREQIKAHVPAEYHTLRDHLLSAIDSFDVDWEKALGPVNIDRLRAVCYGVLRASWRYREDHRPDYVPPPPAETCAGEYVGD